VTTDATPQRPVRGFLLLWILGSSAAILSVFYPLSAPGELPLTRLWSRPKMKLSFNAPGIRQPTALPAAEVSALGADEPVIGVSAGDHNRAYLVRALALGPRFHIVNDVLDDVPVSVTYCDQYECTRLFTEAGTSDPLDLDQGGLNSGSMVLKAGSHPYRQDTCAPLDADAPPFPYDSYPGDVTTWGSWHQRHPNTDVYVGEAPLSPLSDHPVVTSQIPDFLTSLISYGAAPLLVVFVTLLVHVLLRFALSSPRQRAARSSQDDLPAPAVRG
jgi:Protein of unknown function (DUF3179)